MLTRRTLLSCALPALAACAVPASRATTGGATLTAYRDEDEMRQALARWRAEAAKLQGERRRESPLAMAAPPAPAAAAVAKASADGAAAESESITNVQTAGVDEGGIVKQSGEHLVILRRGRLFTVRVGGDTLQPRAMLDAYAPGSDPQGAWYDELLISGSTVVVIGYSYARGGTEIGLFELAPDGGLAYRATWHLRSFDYYSSRNYASRLIGRTLIFYTPTLLPPWGSTPPEQMLPGVRRWQGAATPREFERILPATRVYRTDDEFDPAEPLALHTVTRCELDGANLRCESTAVLGPAGRVFYVSAGSVYVWTSNWRRRAPVRPQPGPRKELSAVFRLPLDGAAPTALKTAGVPIDQLSFLEDAGGHLNVLLREQGGGEGMWGSEYTRGPMALLRVPLAAFGDGRGSAAREHYRALPAPAGREVQNRYIGDWLLWGGGQQAWALRYAQSAQSAEPAALQPSHEVERIEAMGKDALLVGNAGADLHFSSVRLDRAAPALVSRYVQSGASQGETRTHGFFFRPTGAAEGLLGLPILSGRPNQRWMPPGTSSGSAGVLFLRQRELALSALGELQSSPQPPRDDACKASCVDWYGNARPIFLGERVFALLGYELVEGRLDGGAARERIAERRRVSFAPATSGREGRYSPFN